MATLQICAVYDSAVQAYGRPIFVPHIGAAIRSFIDEVRRKADDNQLAQHPDDFELWHLGSFDDTSGQLTAIQPTSLARGKDHTS